MQSSAFWHDLKARFDALRASRSTANQLRSTDAEVAGGEPIDRAEFELLAKHAGVGLGAQANDALRVWLDAVRDYLRKETDVDWLRNWSVGTHKLAELRQLDLSAIRPQKHRSFTPTALARALDVLRRDGLRTLLTVVPEPQPRGRRRRREGYVLIDDDREHLKYRACIAAKVASVACQVQLPDLGTIVEALVEVLYICEASALFCVKLELEAAAQQTALQSNSASGLPQRFPGRAAWLKQQMRDRGFSMHYLKVQGGPDHKTTARILDGEPVGELVIGRLAKGLSVPPEQIPND